MTTPEERPGSAFGTPSPVPGGGSLRAALEAARRRGAVDEELLAALRAGTLLCAAEESGGDVTFSLQEVRGTPAAVAWTSEALARAAGWDGPLLPRTGRELAAMLVGNPVLLVLDLGSGTSLALQPPFVLRLARGA